MITQSRLKELLDYNPDTGVFTRKTSLVAHVKVGDLAGGKDTRGYIVIRLENRQYKAHRLAWLYIYGKMPSASIDHINGIKSDNRITNLRDVSQTVNLLNKAANGFSRNCGKWRARITINGVEKTLGNFSTKEEANAAYLAAKQNFLSTINHQ